MILVTGATGNVGRHVVDGLVAQGRDVRALTRSPETAGLPDGVDVVRGDHADVALLEKCLDGVESVFLVWPFPTTEDASAVVETIARYARRVVLLSSIAVRDDVEEQTDPIGALHAELERPIERSGLEWCFLRPGGFAVNALAWAPEIRADGVVRDIFGAASMPLIHERDIATVAVRALTEDGHAGSKYVLTGAEVLSYAEYARTIGEVIGRPVRWEEISREAAWRKKAAQGLPPEFIDVMLDGYASLVDDPAPATTTFEEVAGVPPATFREWAADHADDFR
ncbi:NmrA family NAD(P)-binding protein [Actinomadura sp. 9N407]|uniref:NmrA family NAD(P)-binding protein n=1 Tax=Actinomadura sp. 9N407 TaxID=3375154 RepID=UPI003793D12F